MTAARQEQMQALFEPLQIRSLRLANRIVMPPMTRKASPGGVPGRDVAAYYQRRALGEVGLIVTEGVGIDHPSALGEPAITVMHGAAALEGWRAALAAVHEAGSAIFPQLWHQGVLRDPRAAARPDIPACRPSGLFGPVGRHSMDPALVERLAAPTRAMTDAEIAEVIAAYARSARLAMGLGFDGIAVHGGHGYLIDDAGGGYWIGRQALAAVLRAADEGRDAGTLGREIGLAIGGLGWDRVRRFVYGGGRAAVATLTHAVAKAAARDDDSAVTILSSAGEELARLARVLLGRLGRSQPVALAGGASRTSPLIFSHFRTSLPRDVVLRHVTKPPVEVAARLAAEGQSA